MEKIFLALIIVAAVGLIVYYLISQKKISLPGVSKKEEEPTPPSEGEEE